MAEDKTTQPTAGALMLEELWATGFLGLWKDREEMRESTKFVQRLRKRIESRDDSTSRRNGG